MFFIDWIQIIVICNGLYDVMNGVLILNHACNCHAFLFRENKCPSVFAYWVFTYGIIRSWCGIFFNEHIQFQYLAVFSYLIEGLFLIHMIYDDGHMNVFRSVTVILVCLVLFIIFFINIWILHI